MTPIYQSLVIAYAKAIYKDGTRRFPEIRQEYVPHVKKYAGENYSDSDILRALDLTYITTQEFDKTMAFKNTFAKEVHPTKS
ncbi:hypothetical protein A6395_13405 [Exiguobacterium sp. SH31]|uniref:hypothetical protein n=1 Tax=Exiguobacterium sp. SH31 TaxID=1843183 RepID=UPI0008ABC705|nr:hypothetical protein [Exiguobacterium sp. SH31]OGX78213.1 hypothetical protein A6395_13405 [Exiguobacterium sp. SH31]